MKKKGSTIIIGLIFLTGLSLLLYPFVSNTWNTYRQEQLIHSYEKIVEEKKEVGEIDYQKELQKATAYNEALVPSILPDSFAIAAAADEPDPEYMAALNLSGDGIMGVVECPKIHVSLPVYHTSAKDVLEKAAGHLEGSSLPVGGKSTHSVITAHRGLPSAALFTDLDRMKKGDHFLIHVLDETLCYEVDQILVVEPEDTDALAVEEGEDYVTLLTCTPYGVNTHRLMVRGHRVPYVEKDIKEEVPLAQFSAHTNYLFWVIVGVTITGLFIFMLYLRDRKLTKKEKESLE